MKKKPKEMRDGNRKPKPKRKSPAPVAADASDKGRSPYYVGKKIHQLPAAGEKNPPNMLEAALEYAKRGFCVLPLHTPTGNPEKPCSCNRADCSSIGKHPRTMKGVKDATTDETQIMKWWSMWPDTNIGIATGQVSSIVVLDIDGYEGEEQLKINGHEVHETFEVRTGREGARHLYYLAPKHSIKNKTGLFHQVDVKADGGYVVAAPSLHQSGRRYEVIDWDEPLSPLPEWLLKLLTEHKSSKRKASASHPDVILIGQRNNTLTSIAGKMWQARLTPSAIEAALLSLNREECEEPLSYQEVRDIVKSITRYPRQDTTRTEQRSSVLYDNASDNHSIFDKAIRLANERVFKNDIPESCQCYTDERKRWLLIFCSVLDELNRSDQEEPWFLACRKATCIIEQAGLKPPTHHTTAIWLDDFVRDGFLEVVSKGGPHNNRATRYWFIRDSLSKRAN